MRAAFLALLILLPSHPLGAQPLQRLDSVQGETAARLVQEGDTLRLFDPRSLEVAYEPLVVESRRTIAAGDHRHFLINGVRLDLATVWVPEVDDRKSFANLAILLGFRVDGVPAQMPRSLDPRSSLAAHAGFYSGTLAARPAQLSLALDGRRVTGFLGDERPVGATDLVALSGKSYNSTRTRGESLELLARDDRDRILAVLRGKLDSASRTFAGEWAPLDGSAPYPISFSRVADYAIRESKRGAAVFTAVYPRFRNPPASQLNEALEAATRDAEEAFLTAWSDIDPPSPGQRQRQHFEIVVTHHHPERVSWRQRVTGPIGETGSVGVNQRFAGGAFTAFSLAECVRPAARSRLAALVLERLRRAGSAPEGLKELDPAVLESFYLVPGGIRFLLPSRSEVILSFRELSDLLAPEGPLGRLASTP